uniref:ABC transporter ATP-binding protein n=1 Tax=Clostridium sp. NkU-1 TaxID=1095009 RepID=UPI0032606B01
MGPNGVGKTTLLRNMMGLLKWKSGGSYLDGTCLADMSVKDVWQTIAYVPQQKRPFFPIRWKRWFYWDAVPISEISAVRKRRIWK